MKYIFEVETYTRRIGLIYDSVLNTLDGAGVVPAMFTGKENHKRLNINIVMGSACNYRCGYCCQSGMKNEIFSPIRTDAFIKDVHSYCDRYFSDVDAAHILFWGGEPLLYFDMIKELAAGLKSIKPCTSMGICTNGALLNEENLAWLHDNDVGVGFSYDGAGQYVRNKEDVLATGSFALEALKDGILHHEWAINPVFHKGNPLMSGYIDFMDERLETTNWDIGDVQMLMVNDEASAKYALNDEELYAFSLDCCQELFTDRWHRFAPVYYNAAEKFLKKIGNPGLYGGCKNSRAGNSLNVDISGNVWACHSFAGKAADEMGGNFYIGTLESWRKDVKFAVLENRRKRACHSCALRMFCGGGCIGTPMKYDDMNCKIQWHKWLPALSAAMRFLTGGRLVHVERIGV